MLLRPSARLLLALATVAPAVIPLVSLPADSVASGTAPVQVLSAGRVENLDTRRGGPTWWLSTDPIDVRGESTYPQTAAPDSSGPESSGSVSSGPLHERAAPPWRQVVVPRNLVELGLVPDGRRNVWYRKSFHLARVPTRQLTLRLGEISDRDQVFLNGRLIGSTGDFGGRKPFGYDRTRLYEIPGGVLRPGVNILLVQVQGYFRWELGIYRDRTEIGPAADMFRIFERENARQVYTLMIYLTVGAYFVFLFIRRRSERENLLFGLFAFSLVVYHFLRTQFKFDLGLDFVTLKQIQYVNLFLFFPLFYYFQRLYHRALPAFWTKFWDRVMLGVTVIYVGVAAGLFFFEIHVWETVNQRVMQLGFWPVYILSIFAVLLVRAWRRDNDARIMIAAAVILLVSTVLDVLSSQGKINLPSTTTFTFIFFVLGMALILANRFVRVHEQVQSLNVDLNRTNHAYSRFVPREFLSQLGRGSIIEVEIGDQVLRRMTILFSDIRSFTSLSETMSPEDNFNFLNSYLKHMTPLVQSNNGFIDKYIGDAIMALFPESPDDAIRAAVAMQRDINNYNNIRVRDGKKAIEVGIGLHTGNLMLGTIGAEERMEGTVISDAVNLASRIEGVTKVFGAAICVSGTTLQETPAYQERYHVRFLGSLQVKGKSETVPVYEVYDGSPEAIFELKRSTHALYDRALASYEKRGFDEAIRLLNELLAVFPGDLAARFYLDEARRLMAEGVAADWKPVVKLDSK